MIRLSRRVGSRLGAALLAGLLLVGGAGGEMVGSRPSAGRPSHLGGGALPASAAADCPTPSDGDLLQGPGDEAYLYTNGTLRAIPDRETFRALGFDPNGVDPIRDDCLRAMRFGEPLPSVGNGSQPGRSAASAPAPAAPRDPSAPAVMLEVSDARPSRGTTVRLTARTDAPNRGGLVLSIDRTADEGRTGRSGLVTTCSDTASCAVEAWEDEATAWTYVATLYRCPTPGSCVAVQESSPVAVAWR